MTVKIQNLVSDEVDEKSKIWPQNLDFQNLKIVFKILIFRQLRQTLDFRVLGVWSWLNVQNDAEEPYFSIFENLGPVEISGGNKFQGQNLEFSAQNWPKSRILDFGR